MTNPETQAYHHALHEWQAHHGKTSASGLADALRDMDTSLPDQIAAVLRLLPAAQREPVAFGVFLRVARKWSPLEQTLFLEEFLCGYSATERRILEAAARGTIKVPDNLPVTLEEFPSRLWQRAKATRSAARLVVAGCQAVAAMQRLLYLHEDDTDLEDLMTFRIPSGDLPDVLDLAAMPPRHCVDFKHRIIDRLMDELCAGRFEVTFEEMMPIQAWALGDCEEGYELVTKLRAETRATLEGFRKTASLRNYHHTRRLGRLMFRFGHRRLSCQCAKALGDSPWAMGWQFQSVSSDVHSRIRQAVIRPNSDADAWMTDPTLACSAMTIPLWLADGVERVSGLTSLFNRAAECPWIFPRLQAIYQWHLALAGKHAALRQIEQLAPELAVGLSANPDKV